MTLLAGQAAVAIENARLYEASTRWSRQLESLNEVGNALATETDARRAARPGRAPAARADRGAAASTCSFPPARDELRFVAAVGRGRRGARRRRCCRSRVEERPRARAPPQRARRLGDRRPRGQPRADAPARAPGRGSGCRCVVRERAIGVIDAHDKLGAAGARFSDDDLRLAETFAAPRRGRGRPLRARRARRDAAHRRGAGARAPPPRPRAPRRDRPGAHVDPARPRARSRRRSTTTAARAAVEGRPRARRRARCRTCAGWRSSCGPKVLDDFGLVPALERLTETFGEQTGTKVEFRSRASGRAPAGGDRDRAVPHRPGGAHQRRQARATPAREHRRWRARTGA